MQTQTTTAGSAGGERSRSNRENEQRIVDRINQLASTPFIRDDGLSRLKVRRWLRQFSFEEVLAGTEEAFAITVRHDDEGEIQPRTVVKAFHRIESITKRLIDERVKPYIGRIRYIQGIMRRRYRDGKINAFAYLEHAHLAGVSLDRIERLARTESGLAEFESLLDADVSLTGSKKFYGDPDDQFCMAARTARNELYMEALDWEIAALDLDDGDA